MLAQEEIVLWWNVLSTPSRGQQIRFSGVQQTNGTLNGANISEKTSIILGSPLVVALKPYSIHNLVFLSRPVHAQVNLVNSNFKILS